MTKNEQIVEKARQDRNKRFEERNKDSEPARLKQPRKRV